MVDYTSASGYVTDDAGRRQYVDRNDAAGVQGTYLMATDRNQDRNAIMDPIITSGLAGNANDDTLLTQAIRILSGQGAGTKTPYLTVQQGGGKYQVAGKVMLGRDTTFPGLRYSYIGTDDETVEDGGYLVSSYGTLLSGSTQVGDLTIGPDGRLSYQSVKMAGSYGVTALLSDIVAGTGLGNSQGTNGYQILPGGTVLQYGASSSGSGGYRRVVAGTVSVRPAHRLA